MSGIPFYQTRFDYGSGSLDYKGKHQRLDAAESEETWWVWRFQWADGNCTQIDGPRRGAWSDRQTLFS
jgi:hypothetical protein